MKAITKDMAVAELAGIVAEHLRSRGIDVVLSGGALVGIYSHGEYMSEDIDFVTFASNKEIGPALAELGFRKGPGRHFIHPGTNLILEFPRGPLSVGEELVTTVVDLETLGGRISVLSPTDAVKDRLAAHIHWKDETPFAQARSIASRHEVDLDAIVSWAKAERASEEVVDRIQQMLKKCALFRAKSVAKEQGNNPAQ